MEERVKKAASEAKLPIRVVAGFDGFVDEIASLVEERRGFEAADFVPVHTLKRFSELIAGAVGRSSLREFVVRAVSAGGCAVNFSDGISSLLPGTIRVDLFATLGNPVHPAFVPTVAAVERTGGRCTSWGSAQGFGKTLALEFGDGKLMLSQTVVLAEFDERLVLKELASGTAFEEACSRARLISLNNWSLYPHMTKVWTTMREAVWSKQPKEGRSFFVDLVDPRTRSGKDVRDMLAELGAIDRECGKVILGLNVNEANAVASHSGIPTASSGDDATAVTELAKKLANTVGISEISIHALHFAVSATRAGDAALLPTCFCSNPMKSVGAGDRFNSGYCLGEILGLSISDKVLLGNASSGFFVRNARSPTLGELLSFASSLW